MAGGGCRDVSVSGCVFVAAGAGVVPTRAAPCWGTRVRGCSGIRGGDATDADAEGDDASRGSGRATLGGPSGLRLTTTVVARASVSPARRDGGV